MKEMVFLVEVYLVSSCIENEVYENKLNVDV